MNLAHLDVISLSILGLIGVIAALGFVLVCLKRYKISILTVIVFSWLPVIFLPNEPILSEEMEAGIGAYIRIGSLFLMGIVGTVKFLQLRRQQRGPHRFDLLLLGAFIFFALVSTLYSIDQSMSFVRAASFCAFFAFLLGLYYWLTDTDHVSQVLDLLFAFIAVCTIANVFSLIALPSQAWYWAAENRFKGLWDHPNAMGAFCMISYPVCLWKYSRSTRWIRWFVIAILVAVAAMHVLTGSRTSMIAAGVGIFLWVLMTKQRLKSILFLAASILIAVALIQQNPTRFEREYDLDTFTGRTEIWNSAYVLLMERPFLGYGYDVESKVFEDSRFYRPELKFWSGTAKISMHNGYLSVAVGLGFPGLILWAVILLLPFLRGVRLPWGEDKAFVVSVMSVCLLSNFFESVITGGRSFVAIIFWLAWVMAVRFSEANVREKNGVTAVVI
jgi:exopolysaccharide production protein ExoQ